MTTKKTLRLLQSAAALFAVVFGVVTMVAGGKVLLGSDPGYIVFKPLLIYNTVMGLVYVGSGLAIWRSLSIGKKASGLVFTLNLAMLMAILWIYQGGGDVAPDSLQAMSFRTVIWLGIYLTLRWLAGRTG